MSGHAHLTAPVRPFASPQRCHHVALGGHDEQRVMDAFGGALTVKFESQHFRARDGHLPREVGVVRVGMGTFLHHGLRQAGAVLLHLLLRARLLQLGHEGLEERGDERAGGREAAARTGVPKEEFDEDLRRKRRRWGGVRERRAALKDIIVLSRNSDISIPSLFNNYY